MDRRNFILKSSFLGLTPLMGRNSFSTSQKELIKPPALNKNATIQLITPASALKRSAFEKSIENIESLGFNVRYSDNIKVSNGFLSGTDEQRLQDLHNAFSDDSVDGVICARGGYGSARLLPQIDFDLIRANAKVFIGYSDITALHAAFYKQAGLVSFHGPVGASDMNDFSVDYLVDIVQKGKKVKIKNEGETPIVGGTATGKLLGGNLSLIASLIGTPYQFDLDGAILFIEEIGESTYRVDRMLTQLKQSGSLKNVKGVALGYFTGCDAVETDPYYEYSTSLAEVFRDHFGELGVPVAFGFPFGHEKHNATLACGTEVELDADGGKIKMLESAVR